jgi:Protein of unknown function DUF262
MDNGPSSQQRSQLSEQRRKVDFDSYDVTVDELLRRVRSHRIDIAPVYQRQFRWDNERQSRLVESVLLGIPVPPLFMATNQAPDRPDQWEVVDGLQRLLTLVNFVGGAEVREAAKIVSAPLRLTDLDKLTCFEGVAFLELPSDIRTALEDRPLKVVVLNDKSDLQVRFDLFERLNTGGVSLTAQEIRECVFRGEFIDLLAELRSSRDFTTVVRVPEARSKDGTPEEFVLRFFAFLERYITFEHSVKDFLNDFTADATRSPDVASRSAVFARTFRFLADCFPNGLRNPHGTVTPVNLFEAVSVGAAMALQERPDLTPPPEMPWLHSEELRRMTTGGTNSRTRVRGRVEFCRHRFLGR